MPFFSTYFLIAKFPLLKLFSCRDSDREHVIDTLDQHVCVEVDFKFIVGTNDRYIISRKLGWGYRRSLGLLVIEKT